MADPILKRVLACLVGQSNERGADISALRTAQYGSPCQDPISPQGVANNGSWWPIVTNKLMTEKGIWLRVKGTAIGSTGLVQQWCGDSVGDGTGVPFNSADGGFDPNGYIAAALAAVNAAGTYDERWMFLSSGQADSVDDVSAANFQLAIENITNYFLANNIKVALGFSCLKTGSETWYATKGSVGYQAALVTFAANSNVIAGADLYTTRGTGVGLYDGSHMTSAEYNASGDDWYDALNVGGW